MVTESHESLDESYNCMVTRLCVLVVKAPFPVLLGNWRGCCWSQIAYMQRRAASAHEAVSRPKASSKSAQVCSLTCVYVEVDHEVGDEAEED